MVDILFWILFGGLIGWIAAILHGIDVTLRSIAYIVVGTLGGLCGGLGGLLLNSSTVDYNTQLNGLTFAIFGAIIFIALARYAYRQHFER